MKSTRRDLLMLGGGAAAGALFTPLPWKLLDDVAIRTQNPPWAAPLPRGEVVTRYSLCTLCPSGCGVKARCVNGHPVGLAGAAHHPVSRGTLCPLGFGAHQAPYHPLRLRGPLHLGVPSTPEGAAAALHAAIQQAPAAILDERPGRAASSLYRRVAAALPALRYTVPPDSPPPDQGVDLESARTILSLDTPLLDGWGAQGRVLGIWKDRRFRLIHAQAELSHTAALADRWLAIRPGSASALASGLLAALEAPGGLPIDQAAARTGLTPEAIAGAARQLRDHGPSLVLGEGPAVAALNQTLNAPLVRRRPAPWDSPGPDPVSFNQIADASLRLLIVDGWATPWEALAPKLARGALVVMLSPWRVGACERADWLIPAPAVFESPDDAPAPFDVKELAWSLAPALTPSPEGVLEPAGFVARAAGVDGSVETERRARVDAIFASKRGSAIALESGAATPVKDFESPDKLWEAMAAGACWVDDGVDAAAPAWTAPPLRRARDAAARITPLAAKLYQESPLWAPAPGAEKEA